MARSISYERDLIASLKDPKEAEAYLNAALEDEDPRVFLLALRDVAEARGAMRNPALRSLLKRENLLRALSKKGKPSLHNLGALLSSLGFRLAIEAKDAA